MFRDEWGTRIRYPKAFKYCVALRGLGLIANDEYEQAGFLELSKAKCLGLSLNRERLVKEN